MKKLFSLILLFSITIFKCSYVLFEDFEDSLDSDQWAIREDGISRTAPILGQHSDKRAIPPLVKALNDPHPYVRAASIESLILFNDKRIIPLITKKLYDKNYIVRIYALDALRELNRKESIPQIVKLYNNESNPQVRKWAKYTLRQMNALKGKRLKKRKYRLKKRRKTYRRKKARSKKRK